MTRRPLSVPIVLGTPRRAYRPRRDPYPATVGVFVIITAIAAALAPPTAYLVPLAVAAWALLAWTIRRETKPRYRRH